MTLRAEKLTLTVSNRTLVCDLDLTLAPGEVWAVLGCNGSGKTTLLHAMAGLAAPAGGAITLADKNIADIPRREFGRVLGILLQQEDREFWGTLRDYVQLGRYPHTALPFGFDTADDAAVTAAVAAFDLNTLAAQPYLTLSGGERQRARLAQLWAQDPQLLLLDEPLQHLDLRHQLQTIERVCVAAQEKRKAVLMVLHDLAFAGRCDKVLLLYGDGRYQAGPAAELLQAETLAALYGCRVVACGVGPDRHFLVI